MVTEMLAVIEGSVSPGGTGEQDVTLGVLLADFDRVFSQLREADLEAAYACLTSYVTYLAGPQTKPTTQRHGLLRQATRFMKAQWGAQEEALLREKRRGAPPASLPVLLDDVMDKGKAPEEGGGPVEGVSSRAISILTQEPDTM